MNFMCVFLLALAVSGAFSQAYIAPVISGMGAVGLADSLCAGGYKGMYGGEYGTGYGAGYGGAYDTGYGCRTACAPACGAAVCDTCQCLKTVVRPNVVERIPYSCQRRVQSPSCRTGCGLYAGSVYNGAGVGTVGSTCSGAVYGGAGIGAIGSTCSGYLKGGYLY